MRTFAITTTGSQCGCERDVHFLYRHTDFHLKSAPIPASVSHPASCEDDAVGGRGSATARNRQFVGWYARRLFTGIAAC
jgi:hypothetical protein